MKKLVMALFCLISLSVNASNYKEPEFDDQIMVINSDSTTVLLPTETGSLKTKTSPFGMLPIPGAGLFSKASVSVSLKGVSSSFVLPGNKACMLLRVKDNDVNPASYLRIVKFEVKKKNRQSVLGEQSILSGFTLEGRNDCGIKYNVEKYGKNCLLITIDNMPSGEYGIGYVGGMTFSTFAVK